MGSFPETYNDKKINNINALSTEYSLIINIPENEHVKYVNAANCT